MIVADTNLVAYLLLEGEHSTLAERVWQKDPQWIAPLLWRSELRQVLLKYVRAAVLTREQAQRSVAHAETLFAGRELTVPSRIVLSLAFDSNCSAYDCEFVALAKFMGVPLVTSDRRLREAFPEVSRDPASFVDE